MVEKHPIYPLLESVVNDNPTFKFPIELIRKEFISIVLEPLEFDYFITYCTKKLKRKYGQTISHIFLTTLELKMRLRDRDIYQLSTSQFHLEMENFLNTLENLYITRIDKKSSDGEMMSAMG